MNKSLKKIIIATGGTGGHIFPAYSLAKHFIKQKIAVELISDKRGMKYLKSYQFLKVHQIDSTSIYKKNFIKKSFSLIIICYAILKSLTYLILNRPNLVFGMGGYASFPVCVACKILGITFYLYENNLYIGKANKYLLPFAKKILVSSMSLEGISHKYKKKIFLVGNLIREEIFDFAEKYNSLKKIDKLHILILGGSQAARVFGESLPDVFKKCIDSGITLKIFQQCLPDQNHVLINKYKNYNIEFELFNFSNNILDYFSKVNFVITRSGASMLAELLNCRIPFLAVPLPSSAENHQLKNAIYYEKKGYSYLIEEKDLENKLFNLIKLIHKDMSVLKNISEKQKLYSDKEVYQNIDKEIKNYINEKY